MASMPLWGVPVVSMVSFRSVSAEEGDGAFLLEGFVSSVAADLVGARVLAGLHDGGSADVDRVLSVIGSRVCGGGESEIVPGAPEAIEDGEPVVESVGAIVGSPDADDVQVVSLVVPEYTIRFSTASR